MNTRFAIALALGSISTSACAIDPTDVGTYRVISVKNEPTQMLFRLAGSSGSWRVENKLPDGTWMDVTCEGGCKLEESKQSDYKRFFPADDLSAMIMSCVHNAAFALCRYSRKAGASERGYVFVALTEQHPIPLRLQREP